MPSDLPPDPFLSGSDGEQLVQKGMQLAEQILNIESQAAVVEALYALDEDDLRALATVLLSSAHQSFPHWIEARRQPGPG